MQIDIFIWPYFAVLLERRLYDARNTTQGGTSWRFWRKRAGLAQEAPDIPQGTAISIRNLGKDFQTSAFKSKKGLVTAITDLTLNIPKYGIYVLLGSNGYACSVLKYLGLTISLGAGRESPPPCPSSGVF